MAHVIPFIKPTFLDSNGNPVVGGKLYTYQAGTTTLLATWRDKAESVANTNPIILDGNGQADIFIGSSAYKFVLHSADDVALWTQDNVSHNNLGSITSGMLADGAVTTAKLNDASVTQAKLATNLQNTISGAVGDIKMHHTFNGAAPIGRGWMICNGNVVNEANYDAIHGAGAYVTDGVGASAVAGKYTPNLVGRYGVGAASTTQDGSAALTSVGNANNQADLSHTHATPATTWQSSKTVSPYTFDNTGASVNYSSHVDTSSSKTGLLVGTGAASSLSGVSGIFNTAFFAAHTVASTTDSKLSATQSIQPDSIEVLYLIKVV